MLRRALDFWMEPPASYSPIIAKERSGSECYDNQKDLDTKSSEEVTAVRSNSKSTICWFYLPQHPLSLEFFLSIRGAENFHLYLWLVKDLAWAQSWYYSGHIFGLLAVSWSIFILCHAVAEGNTNEIVTGTAQMLWLTANVWWMSGDLHDHEYPDSSPLYGIRTSDSGHIMQFALCLLGVYYLVIKPFKLFGCDNPENLRHYDNTGLKPRFSKIFRTWREYENCHILFWLGKDCAWNGLIPSMWIIFVIPTILIAMDFVHTSLNADKLLIDHAHYFSQSLWVIANAVWAGGELFDQRYDTPYPLINSPREAYVTLRWYSSWVLIIACIPVLTMYSLWIYYTCKGLIPLENEIGHENENPNGPGPGPHPGPDRTWEDREGERHGRENFYDNKSYDHNNAINEKIDVDCVHENSVHHTEPGTRSSKNVLHDNADSNKDDLVATHNIDIDINILDNNSASYKSNNNSNDNNDNIKIRSSLGRSYQRPVSDDDRNNDNYDDDDEEEEEGKIERIRTSNNNYNRNDNINRNGNHDNSKSSNNNTLTKNNNNNGERKGFLSSSLHGLGLHILGQKGPFQGQGPSQGQDHTPYKIVHQGTPPVQSHSEGNSPNIFSTSNNDGSGEGGTLKGIGIGKGRGIGIISNSINLSTIIDFKNQIGEQVNQRGGIKNHNKNHNKNYCKNYNNNNDIDIDYIQNPLSSSLLPNSTSETHDTNDDNYDKDDKNITQIAPNLNLNFNSNFHPNSSIKLNNMNIRKMEIENNGEFEVMDL